ncbi:plasmalemma vesicle associated protein a [Myripristis murdjan]|uniref:Plasmalemma vesicle associated protein a n=1 Tax=Myripristis murdjan TaxID=586833 RepID=A0A667YR57_9TELE|nr:plasmalemma vesicle-associated protein-like [Myripristis murdjan]
MYSSSYSQVSKYNPGGSKKMQHRSKGKSCGYYMRVVFFFSSLIQSLIIISLVLFLVYGKKQDSASTARIQDLEESFSRLSIENVDLRQQRKNLTNLLNVTLMEKARNDWDLAQMRSTANISIFIITDLGMKLNQCNERAKFLMPTTFGGPPCKPAIPIFPSNCNCGLQDEQLKAMLELMRANFTHTTQMMRIEMDQVYRERDNINLDAIRLRREKSTLEKEMAAYRVKCKEDFALSLSGISDVSKAFLEKIESLFPRHIAFQLTCEKQKDNLEQIRSNCTSLSREVEDKFQRYLDSVGAQVSTIQSESSRLKAENWRLTEDYRWCSQNRTGLIQEHRQNTQNIQLKCDKDKEKLLVEKRRLSGDQEVLNRNINVKDKEIIHLKEHIKLLNMTCASKTGPGATPGRFPFPNTLGQPNSPVNKFNPVGSGSPSSSATNSFSRPASSPSLTSYGSNKPAVGTSSIGSNTGSTGLGSSSGQGSSKPGSNTVSSSSYGSNRLGSSSTSGVGSSSSSASVSTGTGVVKKPGTTGVGSTTGIGSGTSNTGQSSSGIPPKTGSSSNPWGTLFGAGSSSSNTGQSRTGTTPARGTATGGTSYSGTGSSYGTGRTTGSGVGSSPGTVNINQHLQDLQRIANPSSAQDKNKKEPPKLFG